MKTHTIIKPLKASLLILVCFFIFIQTAAAEPEIELSRGQTLYVPAYSHIYVGDRERPFHLAVTVSIRNTDPKHPVTVRKTDFIDSKGKTIKEYVTNPIVLAPMESIRYVLGESDKKGGSGANFIVEWTSDVPANLPIVEAIMIGTKGQQGISFTSRGQAIADHAR